MGRFQQILQTPVEPKPVSPVAVRDLQQLAFDAVTFTHQTASLPALAGVSFTVRRGETVAFVGPSGSGKTTLVKLLVGLYRPAGRLDPLRRPPSRRRGPRSRFGSASGSSRRRRSSSRGAFARTCCSCAPTRPTPSVSPRSRAAACDSLLARADRGLDTVIGEGGVKVSGGERQRLSIARALLRQPHLLVFDEATSALDSITEEEISQTIRDVNRAEDAITILIAHRLSTVMHADCIYVLERGRIVERGRHDELVASKGLYYAMWRQQVGERRPMLAAQAPAAAAGR